MGEPNGEPVQRPLTPMELEILRLIAKGNTYTQAGRHFRLSHDSIKKHVLGARLKLGAKNGTHAVYLAVKKGLIE